MQHPPAINEDRVIQRVLREFGKRDLYRILRDVSVASRKALLRNFSKFRIRSMIADLEDDPGCLSPENGYPGAKIRDEAVELLMNHGEIVSAPDLSD